MTRNAHAPEPHRRSDNNHRASDSRRSSNRGTVITPRTHEQLRSPYVPEGSEDRFGRVEAGQGFVAERGMAERRAQHASRPRRKLDRRGKIIIGAAAALVVVLIAFAWMHRPVEIMVGESRRTYNVGTPLTQIKDHEKIQVDAGNLVSVSGKTLEEGKGDAWSATVDGNKLSLSDAEAYTIHGGEKIEFGAGADVTEDYDTEVVETQPKLTFSGSWGAVTYVSQWGKVQKKEVRTGKVSGETADGKIIQKGQDCVLEVRNVQPADGRKLVALTFDDGPSEYTERYLQILKDHGATATFFNLGQNAASYPDIEKKVTEAGCEIASHTYSHDQLTADSPERIQSELSSAFDVIEKNTGVKTSVIRPPYGAIDSKVWLASNGTVSVSVLWNMDTLDWSLPGADAIVNNAVTGIESGYIILMHDGGGKREQDLEALPKIIDTLHDQGYEFVTVSELLASDKNVPADVASGNATMPGDCVWPTEVGTYHATE